MQVPRELKFTRDDKPSGARICTPEEAAEKAVRGTSGAKARTYFQRLERWPKASTTRLGVFQQPLKAYSTRGRWFPCQVVALPGSSMQIIEIYKSLQGESSYAGMPCVFVRLAGCNLRCSWCDSEYTFKGGSRMTQEQVEAEVHRLLPGRAWSRSPAASPCCRSAKSFP